MIYNDGYFKLEMRKSYLDGTANIGKMLIICLGLTLASLGLNSFFIAMKDTVLYQYVAHFCSKSIYSLISSFNFVVVVFFLFYFGYRYKEITFSDISYNRWYMLRKMKYSVGHIVLTRHATTVLMVLSVYAFSFVMLVLFGIILEYDMKVSTLFGLCIIGLLQLAFFASWTQFLSLLIKQEKKTNLLNVLMFVALLLLKSTVGMTDITRSEAQISKIKGLFVGLPSVYTYVVLCALIVFMIATIPLAVYRSKYYYTRSKKINNVYVIDYKSNKTHFSTNNTAETLNKAFKGFVSALLLSIFVLGIAANAFLIIMNRGGGVEKSSGYIPFLYSSTSLKGDVENNDFIIFAVRPDDYSYEVGDIVLFYESGEANITKIIAINASGDYVTDYTNYPPGVTEGEYKSTLSSTQISGNMSFKSRWLGAWFLWNNYTVGKIFTLIVPILIILFYDKLYVLWHLVKKALKHTPEGVVK